MELSFLNREITLTDLVTLNKKGAIETYIKSSNGKKNLETEVTNKTNNHRQEYTTLNLP